jgi:hypothetical protein
MLLAEKKSLVPQSLFKMIERSSASFLCFMRLTSVMEKVVSEVLDRILR